MGECVDIRAGISEEKEKGREFPPKSMGILKAEVLDKDMIEIPLVSNEVLIDEVAAKHAQKEAGKARLKKLASSCRSNEKDRDEVG